MGYGRLEQKISPPVSYARSPSSRSARPGFGDLEKLARILVCVKKMSLNNFQKAESADGRAIPRIGGNCDGSQDVMALVS